jgi:hypothetical protein
MFHYHITCRDHGQTEHLLKGCALESRDQAGADYA